jgi:hypothetical protein
MEKLVCSQCRQPDVPNTSMRRLAVKRGRPVFCGRVCYGLYRRDHPNSMQQARLDYWSSPAVEAKFAKCLDPDYYNSGGFHHKSIQREWKQRVSNV